MTRLIDFLCIRPALCIQEQNLKQNQIIGDQKLQDAAKRPNARDAVPELLEQNLRAASRTKPSKAVMEDVTHRKSGKKYNPISAEFRENEKQLALRSPSLPSRFNHDNREVSTKSHENEPQPFSKTYKLHLSRLHCQRCLRQDHKPIVHVHISADGDREPKGLREGRFSKHCFQAQVARCYRCKVPVNSVVHSYNNKSDLLYHVEDHVNAAKYVGKYAGLSSTI